MTVVNEAKETIISVGRAFGVKNGDVERCRELG